MSCALLIAEPEPATGVFLERHLAEDGFAVLRTADGEDALSLAERVKPDLVLLGGELDVCRRLREGEPGRSWNRDVPVIVLGAEEADAVDRVRAFDRGADDFVGRPFLYDELLARIRAVLRRVAPEPGLVLEAGELVVDRSTRCVMISGRVLPLPVKQFDLLAKLASDPTRVFPKDELLRDVWGYRSIGRTRTLDSHASRLRRRLGEATDTPYVINAWGLGYRLMLPG
ncbi:MAG TPA: response regulator transcription factor [Gaiellaceae bacterium]|jgi:DNA-binding response OmpR family regulator|nr:response regulator transcription factor [Gaiellaceae bacterium]